MSQRLPTKSSQASFPDPKLSLQANRHPHREYQLSLPSPQDASLHDAYRVDTFDNRIYHRDGMHMAYNIIKIKVIVKTLID